MPVMNYRRQARLETQAFEAISYRAAESQFAAKGGESLLIRGGPAQGLETSAAQLEHLRGQSYTSIKAIAQRMAGQAIRVGRIRPMGRKQPGPKEDRRRFKRLGLRSIPMNIRKAIGDDADRLEVFDQHEILDTLNKPNRLFTEHTLKLVTAYSLEATGWAFWTFFKQKGRWDIWHCPTPWVTPLHEGKAFSGYSIKVGGVGIPKEFGPDEVVPFYYPSPSNPLEALCPMEAGGKGILIDERVLDAQYRMFRNGIHPGWAVIVGERVLKGGSKVRQKLTSKQRREIRSAIMERYSIDENYNTPAILDGMIADMKKLTNSPDEMDFMNSSKMSESRVSRNFGVNPTITGENDNVNKANSIAAQTIFCDVTVNPKLELMGGVLTYHVAPKFSSDPNLVLFFEPAVPEDQESRFKEYTTGFQLGVVMKNELRQAIGLPPDTDGDVYYINPMLQPVPGVIRQPGEKPKPPEEQVPPPPEPPPAEEGGEEAAGGPPQQGGNPFAGSAAAHVELLRKSRYKPSDAAMEHFYRGYFTVWTKQHKRASDSIGEAAARFLAKQGKRVAAGVRVASPRASAEEIAKDALNVKAETKALRAAMLPAIAQTAGQGAALELHAFGLVAMPKLPVEAPAAIAETDLEGKSSINVSNLSTLLLRAKKPPKQDDDELPEWMDFSMDLPPEVQAGVTEFAGDVTAREYWEEVNQTTLQRLQSAIENGIDAGMSMRDIAAKIEDEVFDMDMTARRAELIARTEVTGAMNAGQHVAREHLEEEGIIEGKEWFATYDVLTRDDHLDANGQRVANDEKFEVGGEQCMYPGDADLSAAQRCNCRCVATATTVFSDSKAFRKSLRKYLEPCQVHGLIPAGDEAN